MFVQCSTCGSVIGVHEQENTGSLKKTIEPVKRHTDEPPRLPMDKLDAIKAEVNAIVKRLYN